MDLPHNYTVRISPRAKYVRLQLSALEGLVIVVPRGFDQRLIPGLLAEKRTWLERAWKRLQAGQGRATPAPQDKLPATLSLRAIGEVWRVEYHATSVGHVAARERAGHRLLLAGRIGDRQACIAALRRWLSRKAHEHLEPWLAQVGHEGGFKWRRVIIRAQRTRWASCSTSGSISLSVKLLFLPPELVRYVLLHELCHTVEPNHSPRFWALLQRHDPDCMLRRKEMRAAGRLAPAWLDERQRARPRRRGRTRKS
jgi:predicted metal-dependent hydrolase